MREGAKAFMEATQNPPSGSELGVLLCPGATPTDPDGVWFVVFEYDAAGRVTDSEQNELFPDKLLASLRKGNAAANEARRSRGWGTLEIDAWGQKPFYDPQTHNLTWSIRAHDSNNSQIFNHSVRLLGRGGVLKVELVADPEQLASAVQSLGDVVRTTEFVPGQRYSEWRAGDKVAAYGLTALIAGGAGAAAAKLGLFGKAWKFLLALFVGAWKVIAVAVVGVGAWIGRLFGRKKPPIHGG
jgi:uncharacterized membrane-anchored protein